ncbi:MAG: hypothetical protein K6C12_05480 [Oscillospiraceae bacterium]|nr:hypothetical protein [Oscillospiraceae bacterium]
MTELWHGALTDDELAGLAGGFVRINEAGCYELSDDEGNYQWAFRSDQLQEIRKYARMHGICDDFILLLYQDCPKVLTTSTAISFSSGISSRMLQAGLKDICKQIDMLNKRLRKVIVW